MIGFDITTEDRIDLTREAAVDYIRIKYDQANERIALARRILWKSFDPEKLNNLDGRLTVKFVNGRLDDSGDRGRFEWKYPQSITVDWLSELELETVLDHELAHWIYFHQSLVLNDWAALGHGTGDDPYVIAADVLLRRAFSPKHQYYANAQANLNNYMNYAKSL